VITLTKTLLGNKNHLWAVLQDAMRDWSKEDAPIFAYVIKLLIASLLAMWLSLFFELDQPRTAMMTVAIVMQMHSGMVFAKSFYRMLGTTVGILVSLLIVSLFVQERILFLLCMAIWIGICTAGSMVFRNHQSYAFVLAGYTLCIVGLPATLHPEQTFYIASTRISEIMIGLICATLVSDLIFPKRMWGVMLINMRKRFNDFSDLLRMTAAKSDGSSIQPVLPKFIGDIFSLENIQASTGMENDKSRLYNMRFSLMNQEFMEVSTSYHAFNQLLRRQRKTGHTKVVTFLNAIYLKLADATTIDGRSAQSEIDALQVKHQLEQFRNTLFEAVTSARKQLPIALEHYEQLNFDTGIELLSRLTEELYRYTTTYSSLTSLQSQIDLKNVMQQPVKIVSHVDPLLVALAGIRGALALCILSAIWILTDWGSGIEAITIGVVTSTLFATSPSPKNTVIKFMTGAVIGTALGYYCNFHLLTHAQGFWMLALALSPAIILAGYLTTRPSTAPIGAAIFIVFMMHIGFNSAYSANPVTFFNDALADLFAVLISVLMYGLIDLSSSRWSRLRISKALRELIIKCCIEPQWMSRTELENRARDLVQRAGSIQRTGEQADQMVIQWLLSLLEIGHAILSLRENIQDIENPALSIPLNAVMASVAELHRYPDEEHREQTINAIDWAMLVLDEELASLSLRYVTRRQIVMMLHFIRSALLDDESVLAKNDQSIRKAT
jgi:uncharacterized membrane protein YccC